MNYVKNQRGLTLVEILASIVIAALLLTMIYSIIIGTKGQQISQTKSNAELTDISYALKVITKEIRKAGVAPVINGNAITIDSIVFTYEDGVIKKDGEILAENIKDFKFELINSSTKEYYILIENDTKRVETEITIRE